MFSNLFMGFHEYTSHGKQTKSSIFRYYNTDRKVSSSGWLLSQRTASLYVKQMTYLSGPIFRRSNQFIAERYCLVLLVSLI